MKKCTKLMLVCIILVSVSMTVFAGGANESPKDEKISLTFMEVLTSPSRTAVLQGIIEDYQAINPNVTIELISPPYEQADNKMTLMLNSEQDLDIIEIRDHSIKQNVNNGKLTDLSPYLEKWDAVMDPLPLTNAAARTVDNTPYLMPQFFFIKALFVRTDILKEFGYEKLPETMEEMYEMAIAITGKKDDQYGFGFRGKGNAYAISDVMILSDVDNISQGNFYKTEAGESVFENSTARQALADYANLFANAVPSDGINWGFNEQVNAFISGTTPFLLQDPDTVALVNEQLGEDNYTVIPVPVGKSGKVYLTSGFAGLAIPSYSKKKDAAWDFIAYISSAEKNAEFCKSYGPLPVNSSSYSDDPYFSSGVYQAWKKTMSDSDTYKFVHLPLDSPKYPGWAQVQEQYMQSFLLGDITVDETMKKWSEYWKD